MTPMMLTSRKPTGSSCCSGFLVLCLAAQSHSSARNMWLIGTLWKSQALRNLPSAVIVIEGHICDCYRCMPAPCAVHDAMFCLTWPDVYILILMCRHHPDLKGSQAATRFVKIQEAYEVVTGKRRGSTVEETKQAAKTGTWDFHDWCALSLH